MRGTTPEPRAYDQGRYRVLERIRSSAHATLYRVYDDEAGDQLALKVLNRQYPDSGIVKAMFDKEVESLTRFRHPAVVELKRHFTDPSTGELCLALELVPNAISLRELIESVERRESEPRELKWCLNVLSHLAEGMEKVHLKNIVHRDLNPNNVLVGRSAGREYVKLVDFGIAKLIDQFGVPGTSLWQFRTYPFVSPEQSDNRALNVTSDLYTFGLLAVALLTWRMPTQDHLLERGEIEALMEPLQEVVTDPFYADRLKDLLQSLMSTEPSERPRPHTIRRVLQQVGTGMSERSDLGLIMYSGVKERMRLAGFRNADAFLNDLNQGTLARYQDVVRDGSRIVNVYFYGRSTWLLTSTDALGGNQEQLVAKDAGKFEPDELRRRARGAHPCRFKVQEGTSNAADLMNDLYDRQQQQLTTKEAEKRRRDYFKVAARVLDFEEERAKNLVVRYNHINANAYPDQLRFTVQGLLAPDPETFELRAVDDDDLTDALLNLDGDSKFVVSRDKRDYPVGTFQAYLPETRTLVVRKQSAFTLASEGTLTYVDQGKLTAIRRQRGALSNFVKENAINPRLAELLLEPDLNSSGTRPPVVLKQPLKPAEQTARNVENALAAQDFFLIQGPPGTGKTTMIAELMMQILEKDPRARILLTAQPNEAVSHAFSKFRDNTNDAWRDLLLTRGSDELSTHLDAWKADVLQRSQAAEAELLQTLPLPQQRAVTDILQHWRERLLKTEDVLQDYARSVQVYGATCLKVPVLTRLAPGISFDWVIVDEAAKALDTEVLAALVEGRKYILVGDQRQLPPHLDRKVERALEKAGFDPGEVRTSLFERLFLKVPVRNKVRLRTQFRMHSSIGGFVSDLFYDDLGGLEHGTDDADLALRIPLMQKHQHRVIWCDVRGEEQRAQTSRYNHAEAQLIRFLLDKMDKQIGGLGLDLEVCVISPYLAQVEKLNQVLAPNSGVWKHLDIKVATIDSFQGKEADIGIYSLVRDSPEGLEFVTDKQRLNVSFSRAKRALFIVGNRAVAESSELLARAIRLIPPENVLERPS